MADRPAWLNALARMGEGQNGADTDWCPDCGQNQLEARYIVNSDSRIGYVLFWCSACLHGITVSRIRAPDTMPTWPIDDPASTLGIPNFTRHD